MKCAAMALKQSYVLSVCFPAGATETGQTKRLSMLCFYLFRGSAGTILEHQPAKDKIWYQ